MNDKIPLDESEDMATPMKLGEESHEPMYPQLHINHPSLVNFPNEGKAVIEHSVVRRTHEKDSKGKHRHRITLNVKSIRPMGRKRSTHNVAEQAMRDLMGQ